MKSAFPGTHKSYQIARWKGSERARSSVRTRNRLVVIIAALGCIPVVACSDGPVVEDDISNTSTGSVDTELSTTTDGSATDGSTTGDAPKFEVEDPGGQHGGDSGTSSGTGTGGDTNTSTDSDQDSGDESGDDPEIVISEADIIQVEGDTLYALSEYRGLSIVDIQNPENMKILGEHRLESTPFEMYVENGRAFIMVRDYYSWWDDWEDGHGEWYGTSSQLISLDARDPQNIVTTQMWEVLGNIADSRRIGDTLYVMSYEDGYCWKCDEGRQVVVNSFDVSKLEMPEWITSLSVDLDAYSWQPPSIMTTTETIYLARPNGNDVHKSQASAIELIDISGGDGGMLHADTIDVHGQITNRWQMSEFESVLRVVSQEAWSLNQPVVEAFDVSDVQDVSPMGRLEMVLPRPEQLQSVRFDGNRGYAITFERTDPLFTLDLSDPSDPQQIGELEIPGWVYHMEPRGDRLLGIGFENGNPEGGLHASLFDVSDLADPKMLSRVNFGGDWGHFGEDQNRIHKAFKIWDDLDLLSVPFYGWSWNGGEDFCDGRTQTGVQLIDWKDDTLALRGALQTSGMARRSFMHRDSMIAVSEESVRSYDISDRDAPRLQDEAAIAMKVDRLIDTDGDYLIRMRQDWWSQAASIEFVRREQVEDSDVVGKIELKDILGSSCNSYRYVRDLFVSGTRLHIWVDGYSHNPSNGDWNQFSRVTTIDFSDAAHPQQLGTLEFDFVNHSWANHFGTVSVQERQAQLIGNHLVVVGDAGYGPSDLPATSFVQLLDLRGSTPALADRIERPQSRYTGGLFPISADKSASWYAIQSPQNPKNLVFYLQIIGVDADGRLAIQNINIPGVPVSVHPDGKNVLSMSFQTKEIDVPAMNDCYFDARFSGWDWTDDGCQVTDTVLHTLDISSGTSAELVYSVPVSSSTTAPIQLTSDKNRAYFMYRLSEPGNAFANSLMIASVSHASELQSTFVNSEASSWWGDIRPMENSRALRVVGDGTMEVLDSSDVFNIVRTKYQTSRYNYCSDYILEGQSLICASGPYGVARYEPIP